MVGRISPRRLGSVTAGKLLGLTGGRAPLRSVKENPGGFYPALVDFFSNQRRCRNDEVQQSEEGLALGLIIGARQLCVRLTVFGSNLFYRGTTGPQCV